jgi:hypothetical protein
MTVLAKASSKLPFCSLGQMNVPAMLQAQQMKWAEVQARVNHTLAQVANGTSTTSCSNYVCKEMQM